MTTLSRSEKEFYENREAYFEYEEGLEEKWTPPPKRQWWEDTKFDPKKNYPRGVLQTVDIDLVGHGVWSFTFFPECLDVNWAVRNRRCSGPGWEEVDDTSFKAGLSAYVNSPTESWNLDEISNGLWDGHRPREKWENYWLKKDKKAIEWMMDFDYESWMEGYENFNLYYEGQRIIEFGDYPGFEDAEEGWIDFNIIDEDMDKMFEELEQEVELHTLRARAGPPSGEYYMRTNIANSSDDWSIDTGTCLAGHPTSCWGSWAYEEWCPEMGRTSLISYPEDDGQFDSFNTSFMEAPIMWGISPKWGFYELTADSTYEEFFKPRKSSSYLDRVLPPDIPKDHPWLRWGNGDRKCFLPPHCKDWGLERWKLDDVSGCKRFSGLKSCGGWMEDELDNEGRFVADGEVTFVCNRRPTYTIIKTKYGDCVLDQKSYMKPGEKVKILCRGNDITEPWLSHLKIKCTKVFPKHLWEKGGVVVDGDFSVY
tara:strand:+ start:137 stop:1576 length:1440 start_codon:yes stop_codon:yes gene_type:complete